MKSQSQILNYLQWSRDRGLIWPAFAPKARNVTHSPSACPSCGASYAKSIMPHRISLLTMLPDAIDMTAESSHLLDKMCAATKIPQDDFYRLTLTCCKAPPADVIKARFQMILSQKPSFILVLGEEIAATLEAFGVSLQMGTPYDHGGTHLLLTHHPRDLIAHPQKKISAWQHLQSMMSILQN